MTRRSFLSHALSCAAGGLCWPLAAGGDKLVYPEPESPSGAIPVGKISHVGFVGAPTEASMPCYEAGGMTGGVVGLWPLAPANDEAEDGSGTPWSRQIDSIERWAAIPGFRPVVDVHFMGLTSLDRRAEFARRLNALVNLCDLSGLKVLGWKLHMEMRLRAKGQVIMPPSAQFPVDCLGEHLRGNDWQTLAWIAEAMREAGATPIWTPGLLFDRVKNQDDWPEISVLKDMQNSALWQWVDVVNLHPYCFPRQIEGLATRLDDMFEDIVTFGKPLGCTEWGLPGINLDDTFWREGMPYRYWLMPEVSQEEYASDPKPVSYAFYNLADQARGIKMCLPFFAHYNFLNLCWWRYNDTQLPGDPTWDPYCGLVDVNGKPKPAYHAFIGGAKESQS